MNISLHGHPMLHQHMELGAGPTTRQIFSEICFFASVRLRENRFFFPPNIKYGGSCKFSLKPIQWEFHGFSSLLICY